MRRGSKDEGNGRESCSNENISLMTTRRMRRGSQDKGNGGKCHNNKKIRMMMTIRRMKRLS
jgi:hypothetical protein